jgi:uncharacterized protein
MNPEARAIESISRVEDVLTLLDWKRRIFALYEEIRASSTPETAWERWRQVRDDLFRGHPQSPLSASAREDFDGLDYFPYDSENRVLADVVEREPGSVSIGASGGEAIVFERFGMASCELRDVRHTLDLYWLDAYGGGVFLPFADKTSGSESYPAGRYLLDSVKGADLGSVGDRLLLDFNFSYNPSCAYDARWVCPLAPPANQLPMAVRAGERTRLQ